jgi:hypothetical protein
MNRRKFIISAVLGLGGMALLFPSFHQTVKRILRKETSGLKVDEDSIDQYIVDAEKEQFFATFSHAKKLLIGLHTSSGFFGNLMPYRNKYVQYRGQIAGHFLLSTDLFRNRMDVTKPVKYTGFYNPYRQPCSNPFSAIYYPETA